MFTVVASVWIDVRQWQDAICLDVTHLKTYLMAPTRCAVHQRAIFSARKLNASVNFQQPSERLELIFRQIVQMVVVKLDHIPVFCINIEFMRPPFPVRPTKPAALCQHPFHILKVDGPAIGAVVVRTGIVAMFLLCPGHALFQNRDKGRPRVALHLTQITHIDTATCTPSRTKITRTCSNWSSHSHLMIL